MLTCQEARDVLLSPVSTVASRSEARDHVLGCASCGPDDSADSALQSVFDRFSGRRIVRTILAIVGVAELTLGLPWLFGIDSWWGHNHDTDVAHLTRDGVIALIFAVASLIAAASRRWGIFCIVPAAVALTIQVVSTVYDDAQHDIATMFEVIHLLHLASLVLIVVSVRSKTRSGIAEFPKLDRSQDRV